MIEIPPGSTWFNRTIPKTRGESFRKAPVRASTIGLNAFELGALRGKVAICRKNTEYMFEISKCAMLRIVAQCGRSCSFSKCQFPATSQCACGPRPGPNGYCQAKEVHRQSAGPMWCEFCEPGYVLLGPCPIQHKQFFFFSQCQSK